MLNASFTKNIIRTMLKVLVKVKYWDSYNLTYLKLFVNWVPGPEM